MEVVVRSYLSKRDKRALSIIVSARSGANCEKMESYAALATPYAPIRIECAKKRVYSQPNTIQIK